MVITGRRFGIGVLTLVFIFGFYVMVQSTSVKSQVIDFGRTFLMDRGHKVGRVLSVKQDVVMGNDMYSPNLQFERPNFSEDRLCWVVRFEQWGRRGHYIEMWIDVLELNVLGVEQCK